MGVTKFKKGDYVTLNNSGVEWTRYLTVYNQYRGIRQVDELQLSGFNHMTVVYHDNSLNFMEAASDFFRLVLDGEMWE